MKNLQEAAEVTSSHLHPVPSYELADHPVPNGKEEIWRFTPLDRIHDLLQGAESAGTLRWTGEIPAGVSRSEISTADAITKSSQAPFDRVAAVALHKAESGVLLQVPAGLQLEEPVVIDVRGDGGIAYGRNLVVVGAGAALTLVLRHKGKAHYGEYTDVVVGDGAHFNFVSVQDWETGAVHAGQRSFQIGKDAKVKSVTASVGGDVIRLMETASYAAPSGELEQFGVYFVDAGQHIEHRLFVDHNQPNTASNVDYRGALQGEKANAVWVGDVLIRKVAENISTYESNKNLLLTDGCRAESVPNLEIETGEIQGAGHSSTTGRFDDEQLFYLRSRGIPEKEARRLVVHGFFVDIIRRIGVAEVEERLMSVLERELEKAI